MQQILWIDWQDPAANTMEELLNRELSVLKVNDHSNNKIIKNKTKNCSIIINILTNLFDEFVGPCLDGTGEEGGPEGRPLLQQCVRTRAGRHHRHSSRGAHPSGDSSSLWTKGKE